MGWGWKGRAGRFHSCGSPTACPPPAPHARRSVPPPPTLLRDLGDVAQALRVRQRMLVPPSPLSIRGVYRTIVDMANMKGKPSFPPSLPPFPPSPSLPPASFSPLVTGQGCEGRKRAMMVRLIRSCRGPEARFLGGPPSLPPSLPSTPPPPLLPSSLSSSPSDPLTPAGYPSILPVRTLVQNLRTGATLTSVLSALAMAAVMHHTGKEEGRDAGDGEGKETGKKEATMRKDGGEGEGGRRRKSLELRLKEAQVAVKECYNSW